MNTNASVAAPQTTVVKILPNDKGNPAGKLADAELHFVDGAFAGLKLIGFLRRLAQPSPEVHAISSCLLAELAHHRFCDGIHQQLLKRFQLGLLPLAPRRRTLFELLVDRQITATGTIGRHDS